MDSETVLAIQLSTISILVSSLIAIGISRHFAKKSSHELKTEIKKLETINNTTLRLIEITNNNPNITLQRDAKGGVIGITISTSTIIESISGGAEVVGLSHDRVYESPTPSTDTSESN